MYPRITSEITKRLHREFIRASGSNSSRFTQKFDYALIVESDRGLITKQSDEILRFIIILKRMLGILQKTLKTCWSKLRDQTKTGSQQIEQQQKKRQTFEFPEVSSGGGRKARLHTCGGRRGGQTDRDGKKENLEGRGEHMAEEPDGVRRNVKIAENRSVSEESESECREVSCRLHREGRRVSHL